MKAAFKKISNFLKIVFGYGIFLCLFVGGLAFLGYLVAFFIGGETAGAICTFIYKTLYPIIIRLSTIMILLGLVSMYLAGEYALTSNRKKSSKHEGEL